MNDRDAFRAIFSFGGTLEALDPNQVSNLDAAVANARAFASEVVAKLRQTTVPTEAAEYVG
jgi:chromosome partitioning protein